VKTNLQKAKVHFGPYGASLEDKQPCSAVKLQPCSSSRMIPPAYPEEA